MSDLEKLEELFRNGFVLEPEYHKRKEVLKQEGLVENDTKKSFNAPPAEKLGFDNNAIPQIAQALKSNNIEQATQAVIAVRKLLSIEVNPPIEQVLSAGILPHLVTFLQSSNPQLQFESSWAITNVASGSSANTAQVIQAGAVPLFIKLLESANPDVQEQAVWALGNIAGDSCKCRDYILQHNVAATMVKLLSNATKLTLLRNATWTVSNLVRGKPQPNFQYTREYLPVLAKLIYSTDAEVLTDACWALSYISDGNNDRIQAVVECGVVRRIIELLLHQSATVVVPALRTVGNIATGDDMQTQLLLNCNLLPCLQATLNSPKKGIRKETLWTLSNITAGNKMQIQHVIDANLFPNIIQSLSHGDHDIKKEAAWSLANATSGASTEQIVYLVSIGAIKTLCELLQSGASTEKNFANIALQGIENILKAGQNQTPNPFVITVEEVGGLDNIEALQSHPDTEVYELALRILSTFFETMDEDASTNVQPTSNGGFTF